MAAEKSEDEGEEYQAITELKLLTAPLVCLERDELREALRLARQLGRVAGEHGDRAVGIAHYRRTLVETARAAGILSTGAEDYWASGAAVADGRVVALTAGWREARRESA